MLKSQSIFLFYWLGNSIILNLFNSAWRMQAINSYNQIDFEHAAIGTIIAWMDGNKASQLVINEFHLLRAAICKNNWDRVLQCMLSNPENQLIQLYGFHSFSKTDVPLDPTGLLSFVRSTLQL